MIEKRISLDCLPFVLVGRTIGYHFIMPTKFGLLVTKRFSLISHLIYPDTGSWNFQLIDEILLPFEAKQMDWVPQASMDKTWDDVWKWKLKSIPQHIHFPTHWWDFTTIWSNTNSPITLIILWTCWWRHLGTK